MTLKYEDKKEFYGYSRDTVLVFSDDELKEEMYPLIINVLNFYGGFSGEVVDIRLIYDKDKGESLIFLIIICFRTLLVDVDEGEYMDFIRGHCVSFMVFYSEMLDFLLK